MIEEKLDERKELLKRAFSRVDLFEIGTKLGIPYFEERQSGWEVDETKATQEIAYRIDDEGLREIFESYHSREWAVFRGRHYTLENGRLQLEGSWKTIQEGIRKAVKRHGRKSIEVLQKILEAGGSRSLETLRLDLKGIDPLPILTDLEKHGVIATSYKGSKYWEWQILEESIPIVQLELDLKKRVKSRRMMLTAKGIARGKVNYILEEKERIKKKDRELDAYLRDLLAHRLERVVRFGKTFNIASLSSYLRDLFGPLLYFDSLLSITQQYGLADVEIIHERGKTGKSTGWSLALFGEPGTGKSFSTRDMILGRPKAKMPAHGVPGRNRYCGGMTAARFIRIGQAYAGRTFNFIVPEFNDFFKYRGMVEPLKLAMEQGEIKYETHREVIGPYRFESFFSVNYNVSVYGRGYSVTVQDPNFSAIEDRMLCRLHRLTKERFIEIAQSQMRLTFGEIDIGKGAQNIRDHVALIYAIETRHPLVKDRFPHKPVMITPKAYELIKRAREAILSGISEKVVRFSARLEDRAIRFACAASLMDYFNSDLEYIPVNEEALKYAVQFYVEEASVRSREAFEPEDVLKKLFQ
ncbi:MAG: hypothetical protein ACE5NN_02040 [Candidatus Bathyarchaeia archaeon]